MTFKCFLVFNNICIDRTLSMESGRMDPLLRKLMVNSLQRSQDERDKNNLSPPDYRQEQRLLLIPKLDCQAEFLMGFFWTERLT